MPLASLIDAMVEKEKRAITTTITSSFTDTIFITSFINRTDTIWITIEKNFTIPVTVFEPTTITRNNTLTLTAPTIVPVTASSTVSEPASLAKVAPELVVSQPSLSRASNAAMETRTVALPAMNLPSLQTPTSTPKPGAESQGHLPAAGITGIVAGTLAFLGLVLAVFLLVRRFYRMYRRERVLRKQIQTEGNEMPAMKTGRLDTKDEEDGVAWKAHEDTEMRRKGDAF